MPPRKGEFPLVDTLLKTARQFHDSIFAVDRNEIRECREKRSVSHLLGCNARINALIPGRQNEI